jgi:CubicO group peptidase (beta-lactamase class C family)
MYFNVLSLALILACHPTIAQTDLKAPWVGTFLPAKNSQDELNIEIGPYAGLGSFDQLIPQLMAKWNLPGGAIAITKDERLVFARGYGIADRDSGGPVKPDSLFRIASVSKSITAVAILKLFEVGKLDLDAKAFRLLNHLQPPPKARVDPRLYEITIRQLLYHSGGWDREKSFDPLGHFREAASALKVPLPVNAETIIRYMMNRSLDFDPGTQHAYSNFGYCILGRVIERVSGQRYEDYVREQILTPIGITRMRVGHTLRKQRYPGEVCYYNAPGVSQVRSALSSSGEKVPIQYGGYYLESMDSHGGWVASAIDLARFLAAVDGRGGRPDLLKPETINLMVARPQPPLWVGTPVYYGMGWNVRPLKQGAIWYHTGALAGSSMAIIVRTPKGLSWAVLFNSMPATLSELDPFFAELDRIISQAVDNVTEWPAQDLFAEYR